MLSAGTGALAALTPGWPALALAYSSVQAPMWVAMARGRAALDRWCASPVLAMPLTGAVSAVLSWIHPALHAAAISGSVSRAVAWAGIGSLLGYGGGHVLAAAPATRRERHIRGAVVIDEGSVVPRMSDGGDVNPERRRCSAKALRMRADELSLAGVPVPEADETKHFKLIGTTGAGKTTAICELLSGALARGDRAIIADPDGGYVDRFFDERRGDVVLSPFEPSGRRWDMSAEICDPYDIDQLALALIPDHDGADRSWRGYARTLFAAVTSQARDAGVTEVAQLYELLVLADRNELRTLV